MNWKKLSLIGSSKPTWVNLNFVRALNWQVGPGHTTITFSNGDIVNVEETPAQIASNPQPVIRANESPA